MNKVAIIVLMVTSIIGIYAGYFLGAKDKRFTYDTMNFMLQSNRDLETVQNIKVLEGLQANRIDEIIKFTEVGVKGSINRDGIKESTIQRAREYQHKYCKDECLGVSN